MSNKFKFVSALVVLCVSVCRVQLKHTDITFDLRGAKKNKIQNSPKWTMMDDSLRAFFDIIQSAVRPENRKKKSDKKVTRQRRHMT